MEQNSNKIWINLMKIGAFCGCHQLYARSFKIKGYQFPVCARCTGLFAGQLAALFCFPLYSKYEFTYISVPAVLFTFLMGIDGGLQYVFGIESNNTRRFLTGITCGFFLSAAGFRLLAFLLGFCPL